MVHQDTAWQTPKKTILLTSYYKYSAWCFKGKNQLLMRRNLNFTSWHYFLYLSLWKAQINQFVKLSNHKITQPKNFKKFKIWNVKFKKKYILLFASYSVLPHSESKWKFDSCPDNLEWKPDKYDKVRNQTEKYNS